MILFCILVGVGLLTYIMVWQRRRLDKINRKLGTLYSYASSVNHHSPDRRIEYIVNTLKEIKEL